MIYDGVLYFNNSPVTIPSTETVVTKNVKKKSKKIGSGQQSELPREIQDMINYIDLHITESITVKSIARELFISHSTLERKFKEWLDMTPLEFIKAKKMLLATKMLRDGKSVLETAISVGYNDSSYFIELFKQYYGITPYQYKKKIIMKNTTRKNVQTLKKLAHTQ